jgi:RNA polymerase sigma-70 factor, ECF subfamily
MNPITDLTPILNAIAQGQTEAFGVLVRTYSLPLRSYLASQIHHMDDVDDLAQDVFLAALESLSTFRREDDFWAWLRGIARNKLLVYYRSSNRRQQAIERFRAEVSEILQEDLDQAAALDRSEDIEQLLQCISSLPDRLRQVIRAGLGDSKPSELATRMGISVGAIYNLHYRATQLLRECLSKKLS